MSLDYVKSGDAVKASTINSIIETLGGPDCPSPDLQFTNTAKGAIVNVASKYGGPPNLITQLFEVKNGLSAWDMQLGTDLQKLLGNVTRHKAGIDSHPVDALFAVGDGSSALSVYDITDGSIKATSGKGVAHTGWTETKIRASGEAKVYTHLFVEMKDTGDGAYEDTGILHLAIADTDDSDTVALAVIDHFELENSLKIVDMRQVVGRPKRQDGVTTAYGKAIQYHSGPIDAYDSSGSIVVDSDLSTFELSSLQRLTKEVGTGKMDDDGNEISDDIEFYEIFDFHDKDNTVEYPILSDYNMVCRWKDPDSDKLVVKYLNLSGETCDTEVEELRQKSVEHRIEDGKQFLQLHDFEDPTTLTVEMDKLTAYDFLIRDYDGADGNELKYATLELSGISSVVSSIVSCIISNDISNFSIVSNYISSVVNNNISNFTNLSTYINNNISNFYSLSTYICAVVSCSLSGLSGVGGISGDTNVLQDLKSIITKSDNDNTWHQLYNFETESPDFTGRYMTIGSLDADRVGKVGKLLDANGNVLSCVDILVRDRKDDTLKYMNLTIDDTLVDTYVGGSRTESMMYGSDNFGNVYLELVNFETLPSQQYLKAVLSSNGQKIFKADDKQTWVLVKQMNAKGKMELMYKELMLDVSLSSGFGISCDTETTRTQKSIEKNAAGYIQLHDFPNPTVTTKTTTLNLLSGTFDLLDSNDTVLVRSGTELKYKKLQLKTQLPGGGSGTTGMTTDISVVVDSTYDEEEHTFKNTMKKLSFTNGLLTNVAALPDVTVFTAVEHQAHD